MEQYRNSLITKYYCNADGIVLVYDITRPNSFMNIESWIKEVKQYCRLENVKMALIGNKLDLSKERKVKKEEGQRLANRYGMTFIELSAIDIVSLPKLDKLFRDLAHSIFSQQEQQELTLTISSSTSIRLSCDGSVSDKWAVVNEPGEPLPRFAYSRQDSGLRQRQFYKCNC